MQRELKVDGFTPSSDLKIRRCPSMDYRHPNIAGITLKMPGAIWDGLALYIYRSDMDLSHEFQLFNAIKTGDKTSVALVLGA